MHNAIANRQTIHNAMQLGGGSSSDALLIQQAMAGALNVPTGTVAEVGVTDEVAQRHILRTWPDGRRESIDEMVQTRNWRLTVKR